MLYSNIFFFSDGLGRSRGSDSGNYWNCGERGCASARNSYEVLNLVDSHELLRFVAYLASFLGVHFSPGTILVRSQSDIFDLIN